jgi:hypothetical protein
MKKGYLYCHRSVSVNSNKTQILRSFIKESFGGLVGPVIDPESEDKRLAGYYRSKLFAKKAASFFRDENWPYPVYVLPYIGKIRSSGVYATPPTDRRTLFHDMDEGLKIAASLGFDISEVKDRSSFVICPRVRLSDWGPQGFSLWVMFHAMIEGNGIEFYKLITSTDRVYRAGELAYMMWEENEDLVSGTFTMASARKDVLGEQDTFAEAMNQELLQRHRGGFKPLDHVRALRGAPARALTDKERALLEEFTSCIKICAAEFVENCRGKVCFPSV